MNFQIIKRTLGWLLLFEALFFTIPLITAAVYWEETFFTFLFCIAICALVGGFCVFGKPKQTSIYAKEGFVIVALSWIAMSLFGALPFFLSGEFPSYTDALFETVSGFTTTGATILSGEAVEALPKSLLMWRSFTHWVGGMGVLVFIMAFLPLSGGRNMYIMKAESPGPSVSKLVPKVRTTAKILYVIYFALTALEFVLLLCGKMPVFEAINTAFSTAGTGGFGLRGDSMGSHSSYLQIVVTVFMLLFSINFNSYYLLGKGRIKEAFNTEVRVFLIIVLSAIGLITLNLCLATDLFGVASALKHSSFSVAAIISTTGYTTVDFNVWPVFSKTILVVLMFVGACAGSTGGGMKVSRMIVLYKGASHEVKHMLHPQQVKKITMDKKVVEHEVVRSINAYFIAFILIFLVSLLLITFDCSDTETSFTSVVTMMNNVGPGLGAVGPSGNFGFFSDFSKFVFMFDMLAGRLEIFPMLILFAPSTWRK